MSPRKNQNCGYNVRRLGRGTGLDRMAVRISISRWNGHAITSLFGVQIGFVFVRFLCSKNGRGRTEYDDSMDGGDKATQETRPVCRAGELLHAHSLISFNLFGFNSPQLAAGLFIENAHDSFE